MRYTTKKEQRNRIILPIAIAVIFLIADLMWGAMDLTLYLKNFILIGILLLIAHWVRTTFFPYVDLKKMYENALKGDTGDKIMAGMYFFGICILIGLIVLAGSFR